MPFTMSCPPRPPKQSVAVRGLQHSGKVKTEMLGGWLWMRLLDYLRVRITMFTRGRNGKHETRGGAEVDYTRHNAVHATDLPRCRYQDGTLAGHVGNIVGSAMWRPHQPFSANVFFQESGEGRNKAERSGIRGYRNTGA